MNLRLFYCICYTVLANSYYFWWNKSDFRRYQADTQVSSAKLYSCIPKICESTFTDFSGPVRCVSGLVRRVSLMIQPQSKSAGSHSLTNRSLLSNVVLGAQFSLMQANLRKQRFLCPCCGATWHFYKGILNMERGLIVRCFSLGQSYTIKPSVICTKKVTRHQHQHTKTVFVDS